jgi:hypothetical protein
MMESTYKNQMERVKVNIISIGRNGAEVDRATEGLRTYELSF